MTTDAWMEHNRLARLDALVPKQSAVPSNLIPQQSDHLENPKGLLPNDRPSDPQCSAIPLVSKAIIKDIRRVRFPTIAQVIRSAKQPHS